VTAGIEENPAEAQARRLEKCASNCHPVSTWLAEVQGWAIITHNGRMKTVMVSARSRTLNDLLKKARRPGLILQSADGQRFVLTSVEQWEGFDVGADDDFVREVKKTARNKKLMKLLAGRRSNGKRIPLAKVKEELGLN